MSDSATNRTLPTSRQAVLVMGMHRSGTSALAGVLARAGCDAPLDLMDARPMNAKGFYESEGISKMNDDLMQAAGSAWFNWQRLDAGWFDGPQADPFRKMAADQLAAVYPTARRAVLKDPRICRLVPFWEPCLHEAGMAPKYLHIHRHPLEVARSLHFWAGYSQNYGMILWLRYQLDAELATRGKTRFFTSYQQLMADWSQVLDRADTALDLGIGPVPPEAAREVEAFLDRDLNHMAVQDPVPEQGEKLTSWVLRSFEIMQAWAERGEDPQDWDGLDEIRRDFDRATPEFAALVEESRQNDLKLKARMMNENAMLGKLDVVQVDIKQLSDQVKRLEHQEAEGSARFQALHAELEAARVSAARAEEQAANQAAARSAAEALLSQRDGIIAALREELSRTRARSDAAAAAGEEHLRDLRAEKLRSMSEMQNSLAQALRANRAAADAALGQAHAEIAALRAERDAARHRVDDLMASNSWRVTAPMRRIVTALHRTRG